MDVFSAVLGLLIDVFLAVIIVAQIRSEGCTKQG